MRAPYHVIQWATGSVGREALRAILIHPALELAGVLVHSEEKSGKDAGELCGAPATGVLATNDIEAILACEADCVVYAPRQASLDHVCALLRSGKSVVCTPFLFHPRPEADAQTRKIEEACQEGSSALHGTGIHPGFIGMVLPIALSGMSRTIDHVRIEERADWTLYDSPRITFDNMRFGHAPDEAALEANPFARFNAELFEQQVWMLSDVLGAGVEEVRIEQELTVAPESRDVRAGRLEAGMVSGQRYRWLGLREGESRIEIEALWTLGGFYPESWPKPRDGWTVSIEGDPSFQTHFMSLASLGRREATLDDHVQAASVATAMQAVNSIPALCEAEPGWRSSVELGLVKSGIGFRQAER
ncbi:MAG: dihydrodipicolinate reductase [Deltaproteobacteria bacterium]|jgi:hypothetical protein|nr:dihydrodipicolinate reductase [Deltaproteobacteria bacterium]MBW2496347.1 dihydrodipicolinate reductase [Deltaproteobacteria bacterium]